MHRGERAPSPSGSKCTASTAFAAWCLRVQARLPFLKSFGFALWVGWFGIAYTTTAWVSDSASTVSPLGAMFTTSTIAHMVGLAIFALAAWRYPGLASRRALIVSSGMAAAVGCVLVILASPDYDPLIPFGLFLFGCVLTGLGTATLGINSGLMLCALKPGHALRTILVAELIASAVQLMVSGLDPFFGRIIFVTLPVGSALCFAIESFAETPAEAQESSRLKPSGVLGRFLVAVFVLSVAANLGRGLYSSVASPAVLAFDGTVIGFALIAIVALLLLVIAGARTTPNFARLFYPAACLIMLSLLTTYLLPAELSWGLIVSSIAYQIFDMVMWYAFAYIVFESKVSAITIVALGRMVIAAGVTAGNLLGESCASPEEGLASWAPMLFIALFTAVLAAFLLFSDRHISRLLSPIPDEDLEFEAFETLVTPIASPSTTIADSSRISGEATCKEAKKPAAAISLSDGSPREQPEIKSPGPWKTQALALAARANLTEREKEVFLMLARGRGTQSISDALTISLYTTRAHTRSIYAKLDVHSRDELIDKVNEACRSK